MRTTRTDHISFCKYMTINADVIKQEFVIKIQEAVLTLKQGSLRADTQGTLTVSLMSSVVSENCSYAPEDVPLDTCKFMP